MSFVIAIKMAEEKKTELMLAKREKLKEILGMINGLYASQFSTPLFFLDNEIMIGALKKADSLLEMIDSLCFSVEEISLYFGIGVGEITISKDKVEGEGLHLALAGLSATQQGSAYQRGHIHFAAATHPEWQMVVNDTLKLCDYIESRWVNTQRSFVGNMVTEFGYDLKVTQREMAALEDTTPQKLNARVQSSGYYQYITLRKDLSLGIENQWGS